MNDISDIASQPGLWTPILDRREAVVAQDVARILMQRALDTPDLTGLPRGALGVGDGYGGYILACDYLTASGTMPEANRVRERLRDEAVEHLATLVTPPSLYNGFVGLAYACAQAVAGEAGDDGSFEDIDETLARLFVIQPKFPRDFDLLRGLVGIGVYAWTRKLTPAIAAIRAAVIDRLRERAIEDSGGLTWLTPKILLPDAKRFIHRAGVYNCGLAHGQPAVLSFLCMVSELTPDAGVDDLITGSARWIVAQKMTGGASRYPATLDVKTRNVESSRITWCYGDPGVGIALWRAARLLGDISLETEALECLRSAAARRTPAESGVSDTCVCHGSAGNALMFNLVFQTTGLPWALDAALFWYRLTIQLCAEAELGRTLRFYKQAESGAFEWIWAPGFLTGATGVAMSLAAGSSDARPDWCRVLLVDINRASRGRS